MNEREGERMKNLIHFKTANLKKYRRKSNKLTKRLWIFKIMCTWLDTKLIEMKKIFSRLSYGFEFSN